jgi:endonuclease G
LILLNGLIRDRGQEEQLRARYQVPGEIPLVAWGDEPVAPGHESGLQWLDPPALPLQDVGFLTEGIRQAGAICRVEKDDGTALGTAFVVGPDLVLTNAHVARRTTPDRLRLRFRAIGNALGAMVPLARDRPVVVDSSVEELDFALLRFDPAGAGEYSVVTLRVDRDVTAGEGLSLLQHPNGGPMKLAITANSVIGVFPKRGVARYSVTTAGGSSGAPCFDDRWAVVAVHRCESSRGLRTFREGVLIRAVHERIGTYL